jgi:prepilin-type N-terminal cleavage/methylation domain-containing protein
MRATKATRVAGFTLNELMFVLAIAGVIFALAIPNMRDFMWNSRMTGAANDLLTAVHRARTESVKRHGQTILCFTADSEVATPACDGDGSQGWVARNIALGTALRGVVMCDKRGNKATTGPNYSAARGVLISATGRPQVTRVVDTIKNDANLRDCP